MLGLIKRPSSTNWNWSIYFHVFFCFFFLQNAILQNFISSSKNKPTSPFLCPSKNQTKTCPAHNLTSKVQNHGGDVKSPSCPDYFRWIHEDLRPWNATGISREMVERARPTANFRLVILDGRIYVETFSKAFQTRDVFTQWGIVQLLRRYPGLVPDLDLMFDCNDGPVVMSRDYQGKDARAPPPLFAYCRDDKTLDIVFPDWSFWGW